MTYTEPQNMTGLTDIFQYANTVSDGIFIWGILLALYIIIFSYLRVSGTETENCFVVAGWITTFAAVFLFMLGLVTNAQLFVCIAMLFIAMIWSYHAKD